MQSVTARDETTSLAVDDAELAGVITRVHSRMLAAAVRVLHDHEEARDAVQDAYLHAVAHLHRFDRRAQLSTWLHRIVINAALMRLRARRRRPAEPLNTAMLADHAIDVEAIVQRRQVQRLVRQSLVEVASHHRAVLVLRDMHEEDTRDAARTLGITRDALKVRAHRARRALRAHLVRHGLGTDRPRSVSPAPVGRTRGSIACA